jgi:LPS sulfotransferase NodH
MSTHPILAAPANLRTRCGWWLDMDADEREEWATWFERHGIDPLTLAFRLSVVADDEHRTITYGAHEIRDERACVVPRMVQLEAPALPFPEE